MSSKQGGWNAVMNALAGTQGLEALHAANVYAGTQQRPIGLVGALNIGAGNGSNPSQWRGLNAVCNQIAGTKNLEALHALQVKTGLI